MMNRNDTTVDLTQIARQAMFEREMSVDYPPEVLEEVKRIADSPLCFLEKGIRDMRDKLWFSIDNDDSKDLDQLTYAEKLEDGRTILFVAIADVDVLVKKDSPIDQHAQINTTSVYTPTKVFHMLPEKLSTDLTSLNENEDRLAIVVEVIIEKDGAFNGSIVYRACVHNYAKLAYRSVAAWLDKKGTAPAKIEKIPGLAEQLWLQDSLAQSIKKYRYDHGALTFETIELSPVISNNVVVDLKEVVKNRAYELIENLMIAANTSATKFLVNQKLPSFKRVVRVPKRWDRIVALAKETGDQLPEYPDSKALEKYLIKRKQIDPLRFPDLSISVIKLLGKGEYIVEYPDQPPIGHFALALRDYVHATAPNRRYPDLIMQRMIKSALISKSIPYKSKELEKLARHCTLKEDDADKVMRRMKKSASAMVLAPHINEIFDALVTGSNEKGTWVRLLHPPVEGKLIKGERGVDVGDRIKVQLVSVDVPLGFIDFVRLANK